MSPETDHSPWRPNRHGLNYDLADPLPDGSASTQLMSSLVMRCSICVSLTVAPTVEGVRPRLAITRSGSNRGRAHAGERAGDCHPTARDHLRHHHLDRRTCGRSGCGAVWADLPDHRATVGTLTPAATWPGASASMVGGLPISVAMRGAACRAMRGHQAIVALGDVLGRATVC